MKRLEFQTVSQQTMHRQSLFSSSCFFFFFFNDTATTEIYTLSLHDALPICTGGGRAGAEEFASGQMHGWIARTQRSEEHTSELQSPCNLVCRLLLEKKKKKEIQHQH